MADNVELNAVAESTGQFSNNFSKVVANEYPGNLITSPLSAQLVLAMAAYGAKGATATQMRSALFIPSENKLGQSGYQSLIECLNVVKGVDLRLANKIFTAAQFQVNPIYKELTATKFLSASQDVDFALPDAAASTINNWCEDQTNKRIKDVISPDSISEATKLILVNAVYFKGQWEHKFDPSSTNDMPFHVDEKTTRDVPTMFIKQKFRHGNIPDLNASFIEIPYQGNEISMIIILPHDVNGLKEVLNNLHKVNLSQSLQQSNAREILLYLPKFKIECTLDLEAALKKLGMTDMFDEYRADFSGIADIPLKVSKVVQKAFIEVNEEGSEAAAVTVLTIKFGSALHSRPPPTFKVDRPFYYTIYHQKVGISLFSGLIEEPNLA